MKKSIAFYPFLQFFIYAILTSMPLASNAQWKLVWSDEFKSDGLPDPSKWGYDVGGQGWGNNELQYYTQSRKENARVENGKPRNMDAGEYQST